MLQQEKNGAVTLGIFQGRLTPSNGRGIQFFPFENWENEFPAARKLGLDEIEFIFDRERYRENPLWSERGIERINDLGQRYGVAVNHICADFFMRQPFFRTTETLRRENISVLKRLIEAAAAIGARNVEIPLVDNSSIKTEEEETVLVLSISEILPAARAAGVTISLETDLPPGRFLAVIKRFNDPAIKANYDTGNSASLGFDAEEEVTALAPYLGNIHIKDRKLNGGTVSLGSGNANFETFFRTLGNSGYRGSLILQAARGEDGKETETAAGHIQFVRNYIEKYLV